VGYADNVHFLIVHHTASGNNYGPSDSAAIVRGIYYFHTHVNLWCDIGYNFLIDQFGQIFEGRYGGVSQPVIGAQAGGFNTGSSGIALIGTFDTVSPPLAMYLSLRSLTAWKAAIHGINPLGTVTVVAGDFAGALWPTGTQVTLPTIIGHRDLDATDCPGAGAYADLPQLRTDVAAAVGTAFYRGWSGWILLAPSSAEQIIGAPAVASWGIDRFDQFVRGSDNQLYHRWSDNGGVSFTSWEWLGAPPGGVTSSPAAVSWGFDRVDVFVRGGDGGLWHLWWDGTSWNGWEPRGGVLASAPAVSSWDRGRLDVFAVGADGALWHQWWSNTVWNGWESRGGLGVFAPAAASWGPGRIDLFTIGADRGLWHSAWNGLAWSGWSEDISGAWAGGPGAASWGPGRLDVFLPSTAPGAPMSHAWFAGSWSQESLGGSLTSAPAAVSWRYNRLDAFVRGTDGHIWHDQYPAG
jgi:hypothetical protein